MTDETAAPDPMIPIRDRILSAALPNIPFDGWTRRTLKTAAEAAGLDAATAERAFPGGLPDLLAHFSDWADRAMLAGTDEFDLATMRTRDRVATLVRARLNALAPYRDAVRAALGAQVVAGGGGQSRRLWRTADVIWRAAGDRSTDYNYYTKRGLLAGVLAATTLYWLDDSSDDSADTAAFLDRRIADILALGRRIGTVRQTVDGLGDSMAGQRLRDLAQRFARRGQPRAEPGGDAV